ncbi:hypothetical protein RhiirA4_471892 [Rhizophagus irregularis]|uniref:Uncharacterized protein n=1 Tax=Rhizophagus irregularis TaxID=588596 RepID=A0A2I1H3W7_9GLOM|nr:hypothetical protein RhiirA4_471892 [Rhizophagus irregularis]
MKAEIIYNLYELYLNFNMNQYQNSMRLHWLYELKTAEQYFECREAHKQFLNELQLNIQIKCLVKFRKEFYKPVVTFLNGFNFQSRILIKHNKYGQLSSDHCAHGMPKAVTR